MRWMKWAGLAAAVLLAISCFLTWVVIESRNFTITGMDAHVIGLGKPGYLHIIFTFFFVILTFIPRIWAKRLNLPITALNLAWAIRNYIVVSACSFGDCPEKHTAFYLIIPASVLMLISSLLPDLQLSKTPGKQ